jgi:ketosteroid isomerase-like protein
MPAFERQYYVDAIGAYFRSMDAFDLDAFCDLLTDDCTITCETAKGVGHLASKDEMRSFFAGLRERTASMRHTVHGVVADPDANRAACDLTYHNDRANGDVFEVDVANQFDFAEDGRIARVRFWLGEGR